MSLKIVTAAGAILAFSLVGATAAPVSGLSDVTASGEDTFIFIFDNVTAEIDGNSDGLVFGNGSGLSLIATGTGPFALAYSTRLSRSSKGASVFATIASSPRATLLR